MTTLTTLIIFALVATVVALGWGVGSMAHGGAFDAKHSHQFMTARVGFQSLAIVLLIVALLVSLF
ncbi:MAG: twin transmembrane helix small protein [Gammaproteobacteria bacterium]|nr:twin transmembrane helix small protein [Gammaproteobacteria bacterium]